MKTLTRLLIIACWILLIRAVIGCADVTIQGPDWSWDDLTDAVANTDSSAEREFLHSLGAGKALSLSGVAGSVEVVGSSTTTLVVVEATRRVRSESVADAENHLLNLQVEVSKKGGTVFVRTHQPQKNRGRVYEVDYRITVPVATDLTLQHVSGPIEVRALRGEVDLTGTAGGVTVDDVEGSVRVAMLTAAITVSCALPTDGTVDLANSAGDISLRIPTNTSAALRATTVTGSVQVVGLDFNDVDPRPSVARGTMAAGRGTIRLTTVNGDIWVRGM